MYTVLSVKEAIYAAPLFQLHRQLWQRLLQKYSTVKTVASYFQISERQLYKWKERVVNYPLSILETLTRDVGLDLRSNLEYMKTSKDGEPLYCPLLYYPPNEDLAEFFGHLLSDGGIDGHYRVHYTTHSTTFAKRFQKLVTSCFGQSKVNEYKKERKVSLYYPAILGKIITEVFSIDRGSKVKNNVTIPSFIHESNDKNLLWKYVLAAYACDGIKDRVAIINSSLSIQEPSYLLLGLQEIFQKLGFDSTTIIPSAIYTLKNGEIHRGWILRVLDKKEKFVFVSKYKKYINTITPTTKDPL
jgi:hypothetical protein